MLNRKFFLTIRVPAIVAALALCALSSVQGTPVQWATHGFTFADGSSLVGGITYDAATNTYSDSLIFAFGGSTFNNVKFSYWNPSYPVLPSLVALVAGTPGSDLTGSASLFIALDSSLAQPGSSAVLSPVALEAWCTDPTCATVNQATSVAAFNGELVAASGPNTVPEPSQVLTLIASFLALAAWKMAQRNRGYSV